MMNVYEFLEKLKENPGPTCALSFMNQLVCEREGIPYIPAGEEWDDWDREEDDEQD